MRIRSICAIATVLALAAAIGASSATAQSLGLKAKIPFEFYVNGKLLPAGTYTLSQSASGALRLHDSQRESAFFMADRTITDPKDRSWLIFHQYGNLTFLAGAYWSGSPVSLTVPASRAEQEIARTEGRPSPLTIALK